MPLLSALEDFLQRSLAPLPTLWEKLRFVCDLRDHRDRYQHWGMEQKFGAKEAQAAIAESHRELVEELTSTKLAELWLAADQAARREEVEVAAFLKCLNEEALPPELPGVAPEHYNFVIANLSRVAHSRSATSRLAA
jgi:hypothetical protein